MRIHFPLIFDIRSVHYRLLESRYQGDYECRGEDRREEEEREDSRLKHGHTQLENEKVNMD